MSAERRVCERLEIMFAKVASRGSYNAAHVEHVMEAVRRALSSEPAEGDRRLPCYIEDVDLEHWEDERGQMIWREDSDQYARMLPATLIIHDEEEG